MKVCEHSPKLRLDISEYGTEIWSDGRYVEDGISKFDFDALMDDYRLVRKRNRQTKVLSVIALILSIVSLIIRILMAE